MTRMRNTSLLHRASIFIHIIVLITAYCLVNFEPDPMPRRSLKELHVFLICKDITVLINIEL
jgi:hypothetical protein